VGYDLDAGYVEIARRRVADELAAGSPEAPEVGATTAEQLATQVLIASGFTITGRDRRIRGTGVTIDIVATDATGATWYFDVAGPYTTHHGGLLRSDEVWKALGRAAALRHARGTTPLVLLTTGLPRRPSEGDTSLRAAGADTVFDVVDLCTADSSDRLRRYSRGGSTGTPEPGFWP
jgi:hypothetical protein